MTNDFQSYHLEKAIDYLEKFKSQKDPIDSPYVKPEFTTKGGNIIVQQLNILTALVVSLHKRLDEISATPSNGFQQSLDKLNRDLANLSLGKTKRKRPNQTKILGWKAG